MNTQYLSAPLHLIDDKDIERLITELEHVTRVGRDIFLGNSNLLQYFEQCVRPNGATTPQVLITKQMLDAHDYDNSYMLRKKIGKLHDTQVYHVCHEIACARRISFEPELNKSLYVFLNQSLKDAPKKKKKIPPRNILWG